MTTPILILTGAAGTGKDTVASILVKNHGAIALALADPMKRLCFSIFSFSEDQLWGPSESRNAVDPRYDGSSSFNSSAEALDNYGLSWVEELLPEAGRDTHLKALGELNSWYTAVVTHCVVGRKGLTPRYVLQTLGTEWGRKFSKNLWVDYMLQRAMQILGGDYGYHREDGVFFGNYSPPTMVVCTDGRFANEVVAVKAVGGQTMRIISSNLSAEAQQAGIQGHSSETSLSTIPPQWFDLTVVNNKELGLEFLEKLLARMFP